MNVIRYSLFAGAAVVLTLPQTASAQQNDLAPSYRSFIQACDPVASMRGGRWTGVEPRLMADAPAAREKAVIDVAALIRTCLDEREKTLLAMKAEDLKQAGVTDLAPYRADLARRRSSAEATLRDYVASAEFRTYMASPVVAARIGGATFAPGKTVDDFYAEKVDKCDFAKIQAAQITPDVVAQMRTAFKSPNRKTTETVESAVRTATPQIRKCLDDLATELGALPAPATATRMPALKADLAARRAAAENGVRGYYAGLGYRPSNEKAALVTAYYYCAAEYHQEISGRWGDKVWGMATRVIEEPARADSTDRDGLTAIERATLRDFRAYIEPRYRGGEMALSSLVGSGDCRVYYTRAEADQALQDESGSKIDWPANR